MPRCDYNHARRVASSSRDVVFLYATSCDRRLRLSIKSLRSSGSLCRIVLHVPDRLFFTASDTLFMEIYDVEITVHDRWTQRSSIPHMIRFDFELEWLQEHIPYVSRVLHTDAFDVFFQGDPFASHLSDDRLTFVVEPHCIRSCGWNLGWIKRCYGERGMEEMGHKFIICSGSIGGSALHYLTFLELLTNQTEWSRCRGPSLDQPIVNHMMWAGDIDRAGIKYRLTGCDGGFFTMQWCVTEAKVLLNENNQVVSLEGTVPSYLHQYDRNAPFANALFQACGL
jgi:hypothetical protein